ncbi:MAG TPA: (2Fe-2S)-binding protein [Polyangiaceae bacterium]|nr:(2Fe-2S)-binding protein [Polyangiaceae bacterium]
MLVCHCRAVTDRTIREAVRGGACSIEAVGDTCGAGTGCGGCHELVEELVREELGPERLPVVRLHVVAEPRTDSTSPASG